jgi:hypothetical protein
MIKEENVSLNCASVGKSPVSNQLKIVFNGVLICLLKIYFDKIDNWERLILYKLAALDGILCFLSDF